MVTDNQLTTEPVRGPAIHVHSLEKSYGELHVLRGVDFDVARGSIFALLGSNGAGKTTVVRILSTLLKADAGTVTPLLSALLVKQPDRRPCHEAIRAALTRAYPALGVLHLVPADTTPSP
jgi:ABC-type branched-subunit amino acid transport system ATPase component